MKYSAIVLSGGVSKRFGKDKGLFRIFQKPLISHVIERVRPLVDEEIIVISDQGKIEEYSHHFPSTRILVDEYRLKAAISGASTGFKNAIGDCSLLLPCDTPLVSQRTLSLLLRLAPSNDAVIPRWPSGYIEPLQAVYRTKEAYKASLKSIEEGEFRLMDMISRLKKVLYLSTLVIKQLDPNLITFHNINTQKDLEKIKKLLERQNNVYSQSKNEASFKR